MAKKVGRVSGSKHTQQRQPVRLRLGGFCLTLGRAGGRVAPSKRTNKATTKRQGIQTAPALAPADSETKKQHGKEKPKPPRIGRQGIGQGQP